LASDLQLLCDGPADAATSVVLAHGAGAPMDSPFMAWFTRELGQHGYRVVRFEFPYMAARRSAGKGRPPDREPVLRATWLKVIEAVRGEAAGEGRKLVIGGKSMGGRMASLVADEAAVAGLVCLGYPFHPTGEPERLRVEHLRTLKTRTLIVQGERDAFGSRAEVAEYELATSIQIAWIADGDRRDGRKCRTGSRP
jgi:predicted alpha/beta-hydrolase family hydrolase